MDEQMDALVKIVGKLAGKYTAGESTSVTYEKAEQLMEAVLYCIREAEETGENSALREREKSVERAYEEGLLCVERKVKAALYLYNEILPEFDCYGNRCLYDTFVKGMPEFFRRYDMQFEPQNTILTLDYPVWKDLSGCSGIDRIYEYIKCIGMEQKFLNMFTKNEVISMLRKYSKQYQSMVDNICEIVFMAVIGHVLAEKPLSELTFEEADYIQIQGILLRADSKEIGRKLKDAIKEMVQYCDGDCTGLDEYLTGAVDNIVVRLKNAAECGALCRIL